MSPRWLDKRTGDHLALDIGYIKATGRSVKIYLPKTATKPETEFEWKIPKWSNTLERDRARTYFQAYAAASALYFVEQALAELHAGRTKTWSPFTVLSIALGIVELAEEESTRHGGRHVDAVHLRLGRLSGVVREALVASYELACEDTPLAGSRLVIEDVPIVAHCVTCDARRPVRSVQDMCCAVCGTPAADIVEGRELLVTALEMDA